MALAIGGFLGGMVNDILLPAAFKTILGVVQESLQGGGQVTPPPADQALRDYNQQSDKTRKKQIELKREVAKDDQKAGRTPEEVRS